MSRGLESADNPCFVCGPDNPIGLRLKFEMQGELCIAKFTPGEHHVGYSDVVHGGLLFTALDDVMANWLYLQNITAYTAKASIRYRRHARVGETLSLVGECLERRRRRVTLRGVATEVSTDTVVCETEGVFMVDTSAG
ncbi:MAG: hotdog fold domain-containing protein [Pseudomonadota bacterium]